MASPTRFPKGLNTFPPRHTLRNFPLATSPSGMMLAEDFNDYIAANWTVTTAVGGTAAYLPNVSGALKLATTASGTDSIFVNRAGSQYQIMNQNQAWFNFRVAYPRTVLSANDTNILFGWLDLGSGGGNDGIFFQKPSGGTTVNVLLRRQNVTTTFQNVADLAQPSGLTTTVDPYSANGTLRAIIAGNAFTGVSVATPGVGYAVSPLVLTTSTAGGTTGSTPVNVAMGSSAYGGNPQQILGSTDIPYGSLYAPYVMVPGSGFTNNAGATNLLEVVPVLDFSFWYDGRGTAHFGVCGRDVLTIGPDGRTSIASGASANVNTTGPSYFSSTQLSTALMPVQPEAGSAINLLPSALLAPYCGFSNTTANIRTFYLLNNYNGIERN